jgi:hypothetical protein
LYTGVSCRERVCGGVTGHARFAHLVLPPVLPRRVTGLASGATTVDSALVTDEPIDPKVEIELLELAETARGDGSIRLERACACDHR